MRISNLLPAVYAVLTSMSALAANEALTLVTVQGQSILADRNQMTAYTFDKDAVGISNCYGACARAWPPILLQNGEVTRHPYGEITRKDGARQITYDGLPLYLYVGDEHSGDINGDGIGGIWHIVVPDENP